MLHIEHRGNGFVCHIDEMTVIEQAELLRDELVRMYAGRGDGQLKITVERIEEGDE
jgi:hypothetical protein